MPSTIGNLDKPDSLQKLPSFASTDPDPLALEFDRAARHGQQQAPTCRAPQVVKPEVLPKDIRLEMDAAIESGSAPMTTTHEELLNTIKTAIDQLGNDRADEADRARA
jgi:hypothetical protein